MPALQAGVDFVMLAVAVLLTLLWARAAQLDTDAEAALYALPAMAVASLFLCRRYEPRMRMNMLADVAAVISAISVAAMALLTMVLALDLGERPSPLMTRAWLLGILLVLSARLLLAVVQRRLRLRRGVSQPALIVGAGLVGAHIARRLIGHPDYGLYPIGFLDAHPPDADAALRHTPVLGGPDDLERVAQETGARTLILAFTSDSDAARVPLVRACRNLGIDVLMVPRLFDAFGERTSLEHLGGLPLLALRHPDPRGREFAIKHALDRVAAALAIIFLSPLFLAIAVATKLSSAGPLLFRQRRVGRDGQLFELLKFRSMHMPEDSATSYVPADGSAPGGVEGPDRRTRVGRWLRRTSLDELPQLINVLRGEMSLVGPRPERPEFVELFREEIVRYGERHRVRSGITGWAQIHGLRGKTSIFDRAEWDNHYIENWSLKLDLIILVRTLRVLTVREDA